jgi:dolichol-phosphate mannosyltransferase
VELPIEFAERLAGESKMSMSIVIEAITRVTAWGIGDLPRRLARAASLLGDGPASDSPQVHRGLAAAHSVDGRD